MVRRSGWRSWSTSSLRSVMPPASPRARIRLEPPSEEPIRSGQPRAIAQLSLSSQLREVSTRCDAASHSRLKPGSHRGGHSCSSAASQSARQSMSVYSRQRSRLTCTWVSFRSVRRVHSAIRV